MDELQRYIDVIFADYLHCPQARRLRNHMLRKIQIRLEEKIASNRGAATALRELQGELAAWTSAREGCRLVFSGRCRQACWEKALMRLIIAWVFSLPLMVLCGVWGAVICVAAAVIMCFTAMLALYGHTHCADSVAFVNVEKARSRSRYAWIGWGIFMCLVLLVMRLLQGKPDFSNGCFATAKQIACYAAPLLTMVYPVIVTDVYHFLGCFDVAGEEQYAQEKS